MRRSARAVAAVFLGFVALSPLGCGSDGKLKPAPGSGVDASIAPARTGDAPVAGDGGSGGSDSGSPFNLPDAGDAAGPAVPRTCPGGVDGPAPASCSAIGVTMSGVYQKDYSCFDLGPVPGLPAQKYGGLTLAPDPCSNTLLIGGAANTMDGKLYAIKVRRDGAGHISGFEGTATVVADAPYNDGGITFGPGGVLFFARWPKNELQLTKPGSALADKVIGLDFFGVAFASASLAFVPSGFPGAGQFKLVSWPNGQWHTLTIVPDAMGTYDVKKVTTVGLTSYGGPEGFVYVAPGNPMFSKHGLLVSEWDAGRVSSYEVDKNGEPTVLTRQDFVAGLKGAEGAYRDPVTGDFFFSTFGMLADRVIVVRGFLPITID